MFSKTFAAIILIVSALSVSAVSAPTSPCATVHIIAARGSEEAPGPGVIGALVKQVQQQSHQTVSSAAVKYPADLTNYPKSVDERVAATKAMSKKQTSKCPHQNIVLVGYSQVTHVFGDVLAGGGGIPILGPETAPIAANIADRVYAVIQMGDPRHVAGEPFDVGTSKRNGIFPQGADQQYGSTLQPRIQSYCDTGDPACDLGNDLIVHETYLDRYQNQAAQFILKQVGG
ncbi:Acetylxylan esterase [Leucoagaricus sp. SymC.cos]|nr:Acetylxylan esterase [Leucoagaricus sp. SymC.cos]